MKEQPKTPYNPTQFLINTSTKPQEPAVVEDVDNGYGSILSKSRGNIMALMLFRVGFVTSDVIKSWSDQMGLAKIDETQVPEETMQTKSSLKHEVNEEMMRKIVTRTPESAKMAQKNPAFYEEMLQGLGRVPKSLFDSESKLSLDIIEALQKQIKQREREIANLNSKKHTHNGHLENCRSPRCSVPRSANKET
jgi:hypothetical protein